MDSENMQQLKNYVLFFLLLVSSVNLFAQEPDKIYRSNIRSVKLTVQGDS